ncbi:MAG: type IV pilus twitching motility protein PilT [Synergistetes bacterium]|nr:type IV pilus twitching motility protein PilT [Synergistota bacterium]MCX8128247.1 type IV pilus twitching motility protein PilT [Synergistota bacterium]MDW8192694.1 type IV pilus twitching motility protein PilT [Synergistota bacterium]
MSSLVDLMLKMIELDASDLHLALGIEPVYRIHGRLQPVREWNKLSSEEIERLITEILDPFKRKLFEENKELDFAYEIKDKARYRVNLFYHRGAPGASIRLIPNRIRTIEELKLPLILKDLAMKLRGLVLVTGPTGSGKNTTLAAMIDYINENTSRKIITIEDPIEYVHKHKKSLIVQREVGVDSQSFASALRHALRQDPDVILIGEMRDLETISIAITAAETGHLVMTTLHTPDTPQTIDRIIDVFPAHQQNQVRVQLANVIQGIISQQLLPKKGGGRIVAAEVMIATPAVRNLIREGKIAQIYSVIQTGAKFGMQTMDQAIAKLYKSGLIEKEIAMEFAHNPDILEKLISI